MNWGLYIHIPYCASRCRYCDFYTAGGSRAVPPEYIEALLRQLAQFMPCENGAALRPVSVYFGGGTPSLLAPEQVEMLLAAANPLPGAEITLEANPESATASRLAGWRKAGVNRLSVGVQSARDDSLRRLGRLHTAADARRALEDARRAGFEKLSGDIMLALPAYTRAEFDETLALLERGGVSHVSAYLLKIEPGTAFGENPPPDLPDDDEAADFYLYAAERLRAAGYARYEISNFAQRGAESRHNLLYWNCESWLGIGPAAHSCLSGARFSFAADVPGFLAGDLPPCPEGRMGVDDYVMLRLRLDAGLDETQLNSRFSAAFTSKQRVLLRRLVEGGLAVWENGVVALTTRGMLMQNSILTQLGSVAKQGRAK